MSSSQWASIWNRPAKSFQEKESQTIIRVYPHILESNLFAHLSAERKCQTEISIKPDEDKKFYSMLEYMPNQDIQQDYVRIIPLPRKPRLLIVSHSIELLHLGDCLLLDDDGLSEICLELRERLRSGAYKNIKTFVDKEMQTDLKVSPHILGEEDIAIVVSDVCTDA